MSMPLFCGRTDNFRFRLLGERAAAHRYAELPPITTFSYALTVFDQFAQFWVGAAR